MEMNCQNLSSSTALYLSFTEVMVELKELLLKCLLNTSNLTSKWISDQCSLSILGHNPCKISLKLISNFSWNNISNTITQIHKKKKIVPFQESLILSILIKIFIFLKFLVEFINPAKKRQPSKPVKCRSHHFSTLPKE